MNDMRRQHLHRVLNLPVPRVYRDRSCPFDTLSDHEFRLRYRFTRNGFFSIVEMLDGDLKHDTLRSSSLTTAQQLAMVLNVLACNSFQLHAGDLSGVTQSTVSRTLKRVTNWFVHNADKFVEWHTPESETAMQIRVYQKYGLPGVVGCIDGTHIKIIAPTISEDRFVNRKGYHSLNVACIVDDNFKFRWFTARWPGRSHDSRVWRESHLHRRFVNGEITGRLVGDSAYRAETFMLKIFNGRDLSQQQQRYNDAVCGFRVHIEQAFGQLKRQFHALHGELRYDPIRASAIVTTAICLRNVSVTLREPSYFADVRQDFQQPDPDLEVDTSNGSTTMRSIADNYFS